MLSNISCAFAASSLALGITFWAWILPWVYTAGLQHQIVWKSGNEWARSRCAWCISGPYESFRMIVTKTGRLCALHLLPHYALRSQVLANHPEEWTSKRNSHVRSYPLSHFLQHVGINAQSLRGEEKKITYQRYFYLLLLYGSTDLVGKFSSAFLYCLSTLLLTLVNVKRKWID